MIDLRYKPKYLPQVSAPFAYTLDGLKREGVKCKYVEMNPEDLIPSQGLVALDKISSIDPKKILPIWISKENKVLDGHHRLACVLMNSLPIKAIQIPLPYKDAIRILNKIQDIYDYENQEKVEEVVAQDQINAMNEPENQDFLESLEAEVEDGKLILHDTNAANVVGKKTKKQTGYRKAKINERSTVGNFFSLKPVEGYLKYDIEFDNLLDTNDMGLIYSNGISPVGVLARAWFPHIDFNKISKKYGVSPDVLINRAVAEKARKCGYDGIKYGDIMIQGLN